MSQALTMSNLIISKFADSIISVASVKQASSHDWLNDLTGLIEQVFEQGDTLLVLTNIQLDEITDHHAQFNELVLIPIDKKWFRVNANYETPKSVIKQLIWSQEFLTGNLFICKWHGQIDCAPDTLINDCEQIVTHQQFLEMPLLKHEFLACTADGYEVLWFNPSGKLSKTTS